MPVATTTALLALTAAASAGSQAAGSIKAGNAANAAGKYQQRVATFNAAAAALQADDALRRGEEVVGQSRANTAQTLADQRVGYAASGVDTTVGSAAEVQRDTSYLGELDQRTIALNAKREAWGYKVESANATAQGQLARQAGRNAAGAGRIAAAGSILSGAGQVYGIGKEYGWKRPAAPSLNLPNGGPTPFAGFG